jgi:hypothetical protein
MTRLLTAADPGRNGGHRPRGEADRKLIIRSIVFNELRAVVENFGDVD